MVEVSGLWILLWLSLKIFCFESHEASRTYTLSFKMKDLISVGVAFKDVIAVQPSISSAIDDIKCVNNKIAVTIPSFLKFQDWLWARLVFTKRVSRLLGGEEVILRSARSHRSQLCNNSLLLISRYLAARSNVIPGPDAPP